MGTYKLLLDADAQTESNQQGMRSVPSESADGNHGSQELTQQMVRMELSLVSRLNELEIQNAELRDALIELTQQVGEFKSQWEQRVGNEKDSDVLMRNVGLLS